MPKGRVAASVPENLSLFLDPPAKNEESSKKMSKDSILSLYSSVTPQTNMAANGTERFRIIVRNTFTVKKHMRAHAHTHSVFYS